jgi:hypothetical protein
MDGVQSAFSALGMDSTMIQQFVPIVMGFLGDQGVGSSLLGQLQSRWAPASCSYSVFALTEYAL